MDWALKWAWPPVGCAWPGKQIYAANEVLVLFILYCGGNCIFMLERMSLRNTRRTNANKRRVTSGSLPGRQEEGELRNQTEEWLLLWQPRPCSCCVLVGSAWGAESGWVQPRQGLAAASVFVVHMVTSGPTHEEGMILCVSWSNQVYLAVLLVITSIFNNLLYTYGLTFQRNQINLTELASKCYREVSGSAELSTDCPGTSVRAQGSQKWAFTSSELLLLINQYFLTYHKGKQCMYYRKYWCSIYI